MAYVATAASFGLMAWTPLPWARNSTLPDELFTTAIGWTRWRTPPEASVAYAFVMSMGLTA